MNSDMEAGRVGVCVWLRDVKIYIQIAQSFIDCVCLPWVRGVWQYKDVLEPKLESRGLGIVGIKSVFRRATLR